MECHSVLIVYLGEVASRQASLRLPTAHPNTNVNELGSSSSQPPPPCTTIIQTKRDPHPQQLCVGKMSLLPRRIAVIEGYTDKSTAAGALGLARPQSLPRAERIAGPREHLHRQQISPGRRGGRAEPCYTLSHYQPR